MPYARPALTQLRDQALQDITAGLITDSTTNNTLVGFAKVSILRILAYAMAGLAWLEYLYLDWISRMSVPWSARDEFLVAWAALIGVLQKASSKASGTVSFAGSPNGTDMPSGTLILRGDGVQYVTTADAVVTAGFVVPPVIAVLGGSLANAPIIGTPVSLLSPISGISASGVTASVITGGADPEATDPFRTRMLQQFAAPPQGGDRSDYIEWAEAVPGVTRAWVIPNGGGAGTVLLYFMEDVAEAAFGGFPQGTNGVAANDPRDLAATGDQLVVANAVFAKQPVTALVYALAPARSPVNFTIANFSPNTTAMQTAVQASLDDMFLRLGQVGGTVNPQSGALWGTLYPSDIEAAIAGTLGVQHFTLSSPSGPITPGVGSLFTRGSTTFTP